MFQFNQTHILNSTVDAEGNVTILDELSGLPKCEACTDTKTGKDAAHIRRINKFIIDNICNAWVRKASDPVLGSLTIPMVNDGPGIYRVVFYMRLSGSQNSYYSNDFVFKGKPFAYEFKVTADDAAADMATKAAEAITKIQTFYGDKWVKAEADGDNLVIKATTEYQLFTFGALQELNVEANNPLTNEKFEDVEGVEVEIVKSVEGFGTYTHLMKDIKLPTLEHLAWEAHDKEQLPVPGVKYNQYTIEYLVDRGHFGGAAVGQQVTSKTTHVFYVAEAAAEAFEAAFPGVTFEEVKNLEAGEVGGTGEVEP